MPQDLIRYDLLVQDALKGVVRRVLSNAAAEGMPGDHHFYISFRTQDSGVRISQRLRDKYPDEMTIVLQHQFWDLAVTEHAFEVGLSFSGIPERLLVPFDSLTGFFDPSVQFGLKFELSSAEPADNDEDGDGAEDEAPAARPSAPIPLAAPQRRPEGVEAKPGRPRATEAVPASARPADAKASPRTVDAKPGDGKAAEGKAGEPKAAPAKARAPEPAKAKSGKAEAAKADGSEAAKPDGAEVVSLDAFRKKT